MEERSRIKELSFEDVMGERFGRYSKYIIQERALPDIRDGLKPVQRRILFAMNEDGNTFNKAYKKSAKAVGNVMGNYHPHGDASIYDAIVRMSQTWKMREPLIDMNGNNGSIDNDPPAAMRYTEVRLSKIAQDMLTDLDQNTVNMVLNFDDTRYEPVVLPSRIPNLLINGASGISAGYATEIPPHNLEEIINALSYLLSHPKATLDRLMNFVKGPDFPTGGIIQGIKGIKEAYETGKGRIFLRAKTNIVPLKAGKKEIKITELPYEVNKAALVSRIEEIKVNREINGIIRIHDDTSREGLLVIIELNRQADAQSVLDYLFKKTDLQISYNFNMTAIKDHRPVLFGLKQALNAFIAFRKEVVTRRTKYLLTKALNRQEIVDGLIKMLSILDQVINTIRSSSSRKNAKHNLIKKFTFSSSQAEAIVTLQLYKLSNTDVTSFRKEQKKLKAKIRTLNLILNNEKELNKVIKKEFSEIKRRYRTSRLSQIQEKVPKININKKTTIEKRTVMVQITKKGYIKRTSYRSFKASQGHNGLSEGDYPIFTKKTDTLKQLFIFTNEGHLIYQPVNNIKQVKWKEIGDHLSQNFSGLNQNEEIIAANIFNDPLNSEEKQKLFLFITNNFFLKRVPLKNLLPSKFYKKRANKALILKKNTFLKSAILVSQHSENQLLTVSKKGYLYKIKLSKIRIMSPKSKGSKLFSFLKEDEIIDNEIFDTTQKLLLIVTQKGNYKIINPKKIPTSNKNNLIKVKTSLKRGEFLSSAVFVEPHKRNYLEAITNTNQTIPFMTTASNIFSLKEKSHPRLKIQKNSIIVLVRKLQEVN